MPNTINMSQFDALNEGGKHWLHPSARYAKLIEDVRAKHRAKHEDERKKLREAGRKLDAMVKK
jgi:hypothetical protein